MWTFESLGTGMPSKIAAFVKAAELEQMVLMCPKQHLEWYTQESSTRLCILFPADFNAQEKNTRDCFRNKIIQNLHNASTRYGLTRTGSWNFQQTHPTQSVPIVATCLGKANSGTRSVCLATWHSGCKAYISQTPPNSSKSADPLCCQDAKSQIQTSQTEIQNPKANLRFGCFPSASALCNFVQLIPPRSIKSFGEFGAISENWNFGAVAGIGHPFAGDVEIGGRFLVLRQQQERICNENLGDTDTHPCLLAFHRDNSPLVRCFLSIPHVSTKVQTNCYSQWFWTGSRRTIVKKKGS